METLKDIKDALKDVPDELLENFCFGCGEGAEETIQLITTEEPFPEQFEKLEKYPKVLEFGKLVGNIIKAQSKLDVQKDESFADRVFEEPITSDYFKEEKEKS